MSFAKKLLIVLALVAGVALAALALFLATFDGSRYRELILSTLSTSLNREVEAAAVELNLFPFRLRLNQLQVSEDPGFGEGPFLRADGVEVQLRLLSFLSGTPEILAFELDHPVIQLRQNSAGNWNVSTLGPAKKTEKADQTVGAEAAAGAATLLVRSWRMREGTLNIERSGAEPIAVSGFNLVLFNFDFQSEIPFRASFNLKEGSPLEADGSIGPLDPTDQRIPFQVHLQARDGNLEGLTPLIQAFAGSALSHLQLAGSFTGEATVRRSSSLAQTDFLGDFELRNVSLKSDRLSLPAQLYSADFHFDPKGFELNELRASLDQSQLQGSIQLLDLENPQLKFALQGDQLDVDQLALLFAGFSATGARAHSDDAESPSWQHRIRGQGQVKIGELRSGTLTLAPFEANLKSSQGIVTLEPMKFGFYDGTASGKLIVNSNLTPPLMELELGLKEVNVDQLLRANGQPENHLQGLLEGRVNVRFQGTAWEEIADSATGQGDSVVNKGRLSRLNLNRELAAVTRLAGLSIDRQDTPLEEMSATFSIGGGWIRTTDLTIQTPELRLVAEGGFSFDDRLDFEATAFFNQESSQNVSNLGLVGRIAGNLLIDEDGRAVVPFDVTGTAAQPRFSLDAARLARMRSESGRSKPGDLLKDLMQRLRKPSEPPP